MNYLVTFFTHFDAMSYQHSLSRLNIQGTLMPVPRKVSSSCGTCVTFTIEEALIPELDLIQMEDYAEIFQIMDESYILLHKNE